MKDIFKMGFTLMIFMAIAGFLVGLVYIFTKPYIDKAELNAKLKAIKEVLEDPITGKLLIPKKQVPTNFKELSEKIWKKSEEEVLKKYPDNTKIYSPVYLFHHDDHNVYVLTVSGVGFGGDVVSVISICVDKDGKYFLNKIEVVNYSQETPGLGAKISEENVKKRFYMIPEEGLKAGVKVNKDAGVLVPESKIDEFKKKGIVQTSDIMTGATITPRAVANSINAAVRFLKENGVIK